ncbi:MAG TPA: cytochrome c oxidase assembly factor Coa1 family protein [Candidatus Acidoferrales bacterium]|nr:cytochrome c oxidase assembly factor Coa1 family protein [Candidatus Acidoferrales bacterium]
MTLPLTQALSVRLTTEAELYHPASVLSSGLAKASRTSARPGSPPPGGRRNSGLNNWKVVVPVLGGGALLCLGALVFGIFSLVYSMIRSSYPYKFAVESASNSAEVSGKIGTPFHVGWFLNGNINYNNSDGAANFTIPISGAKGRGSILVVANERAGNWSFETLEVDVEGRSTPIQLPNITLLPLRQMPEASR